MTPEGMYNTKNYSLKVSICCVTYNHENFIRKCLDGFLMQQTSFPIEVIIHDDASRDGTKVIIEEYTRKYPDIFFPLFQKENQYRKGIRGMNAKFNFPRCTGKYIALCEGDDFWNDPHKLQKQVDFLESNRDYFITGHDANIIDEKEKIISNSKLPEICKRDCSSIELQKCFFVLTLSMCFRNVPELMQMPEELYLASNADTFMISYFGRFGKYKYLPEIIPATYRVHSNGIWAMKNELEKQIMTKNTFRQLTLYYTRTTDRRMELYHSKMLLKFSGSVLKKKLASTNGVADFCLTFKNYIIENRILTKPSILLKLGFIYFLGIIKPKPRTAL
jgi:glycosyltransferase involved in cell wall biosynthesis